MSETESTTQNAEIEPSMATDGHGSPFTRRVRHLLVTSEDLADAGWPADEQGGYVLDGSDYVVSVVSSTVARHVFEATDDTVGLAVAGAYSPYYVIDCADSGVCVRRNGNDRHYDGGIDSEYVQSLLEFYAVAPIDVEVLDGE